MSFAPQGSIIRSCNGMFMAIPMNPIKIGSKIIIKNDEKNNQHNQHIKPKSPLEQRNEVRASLYTDS